MMIPESLIAVGRNERATASQTGGPGTAGPPAQADVTIPITAHHRFAVHRPRRRGGLFAPVRGGPGAFAPIPRNRKSLLDMTALIDVMVMVVPLSDWLEIKAGPPNVDRMKCLTHSTG